MVAWLLALFPLAAATPAPSARGGDPGAVVLRQQTPDPDEPSGIAPTSGPDDAEGDPPEQVPRKEADFLTTDVELRLRVGFNGFSPGPFSIVTAFAGWNEFALVLDVGALAWRDFTIGFGGSIHYDQAAVLGAVSQRIANYDDYEFRWRMYETGGLFRTTFHFTALQGVDPYLVGGVGAGLFRIEARVRDWPLELRQHHEAAYLRVELGGGLSFLLKGDRWVVGGELRYLITSQFGAEKQFLFDYEGASATFSFFPQHKPPKGFAWGVHLGYRF